MYRIVTEDRPNYRETIDWLLARAGIKGWTILHGEGAWEGEREKSLVIELSGVDYLTVCNLAKEIKIANNQQAVMVQTIVEAAEFI